MPAITFQNEDIPFNLPEKTKIRNWIKKIILQTGPLKTFQINFIFCSDQFLHNLNKTYLKHDTFTDIITFDYSESDLILESDVFISVERVKENSTKYNADFLTELRRVMIHGILHLLGYTDKTKDQREKMREKENECLNLYHA